MLIKNEPKFVWQNGRIIKWNESKISLLTHALHYGTAVFEGIRAYPSKDNLNIFRLKEHLKRLLFSAKVYFLSNEYTIKEMSKSIINLIQKNNFHKKTYIRPLIYVGDGGIGLNFTGFPIETAIIAIPFTHYFLKSKLRVKVSTWRKISHDSNPAMAKASGNYLNSVLGKLEAIRDGYDEAIMLDQRGFVSEGTGENIFLVKNKIIYTPAVSSSILLGITRDTVITLANDLGYKIIEREIDRAELYDCDEAFFTGTAAEIAPITELDNRLIGDGKIGIVSGNLRDAYIQTIEGKNDKYNEWLTKVY